MDTVLQDLRYAIRTLRKSHGFTAVAGAHACLGSGASAAVFAIVDARKGYRLRCETTERGQAWRAESGSTPCQRRAFASAVLTRPSTPVAWLDPAGSTLPEAGCPACLLGVPKPPKPSAAV
jgi:hypothetical protein